MTARAHERDDPRHAARNLGLDGTNGRALRQSRSTTQHHALLYVPENFPERNDPRAEAAIVEELVELIGAAGGRTLALFTNRAVMNRVADAVAPAPRRPRSSSRARCRATGSSRSSVDSAEASLFAVTSFWQGVDVPGPLAQPRHDRPPALQRAERPPRRGPPRALRANPFYEVDLPRATMLLAQGVGRLIRTSDDRGVVAVLDTRLAEASYAATLFRKLPPMRRTRDRAQVRAFLELCATGRK